MDVRGPVNFCNNPRMKFVSYSQFPPKGFTAQCWRASYLPWMSDGLLRDWDKGRLVCRGLFLTVLTASFCFFIRFAHVQSGLILRRRTSWIVVGCRKYISYRPHSVV